MHFVRILVLNNDCELTLVTGMDRITQHGRLFTCTVCLGKDGRQFAPMVGRQMAVHVNGPRHQRRVKQADVHACDTSFSANVTSVRLLCWFCLVRVLAC
jgi:hypothetical protein